MMTPRGNARGTSGFRDTYWLATRPAPAFPPLAESIDADVLIVGAGVTGITAAFLLASEGRRVALIDSGAIWSGETGRTTAHLTEELDFGYAEIIRVHGEEDARLAFESQREALRLIDSHVSELSIDCDYSRVDAFLFLHPDDDVKSLDEEMDALGRVGFFEASRVASVRLGSVDAGPGIRFPDQAQFHPLKYLSALLERAVESGVRVYADTRAAKVDSGLVLTDQGHKIRAEKILVTTHSPIKNILFFVKESAFRTYVVAARIPPGSAGQGLFWDSGDPSQPHEPYHYVRLAEEDLLIVGGEDHKTGQADDADERYARLESWARERFPGMGEVEYRWSGQVIEPVDSLPYIGKSPYHDGIYIATGYSGNGITNGTLAARILADLALGRKNRFAALYDPTRKRAGSAGDFARENLDSAKHALGDRLKRAETSAEELESGQGAIVGAGPNKIAAYRDESGKLFECSATCTHLGCVVQWNTGERTFDCPCHGSRFSAEGKVITGPATRDLKALHPAPHV